MMVANTAITMDLFVFIQTNATINDFNFTGITGPEEVEMIVSVSSSISISNSYYSNSNLTLLISSFSTMNIDGLQANSISGIKVLTDFRSWSFENMKNINFDLITSSSYPLSLIDSNVTTMDKISLK